MTTYRFKGMQRKGTSGAALLVVLTVLALMTILLVANGRTVWHLNRELRLIEKRQVQHWTRVAGKLPPARHSSEPVPDQK